MSNLEIEDALMKGLNAADEDRQWHRGINGITSIIGSKKR